MIRSFMNSDTPESRVKVVLDTNILISAIGFGGKPRDTLLLVFEDKIMGVISPILLAELQEVIVKKFLKLMYLLPSAEQMIRRKFLIVRPKKSLHIVRDEDDNRVLEAAIEGKCDYIITGDKDLLSLQRFKKIKIFTPDQFLKEIGCKGTL